MDFSSHEIARLAEVAGLDVPLEDLEPLVEALRAHCDAAASLMESGADELTGWEGFSALTFDARW